MSPLQDVATRAMLALAECAVMMQTDQFDDIINQLFDALNPDEVQQ